MLMAGLIEKIPRIRPPEIFIHKVNLKLLFIWQSIKSTTTAADSTDNLSCQPF